MSEKSSCAVSFGTVQITNFDFADETVIFAVTTEVLSGALDSLIEEAELHRLEVPCIKTKVKVIGEKSISLSGENVEMTQTFTFLGSVIHKSTSCDLDVNLRLGGRTWSAMNSPDEGVWCCRYSCNRTNVRVIRSLVLPVLLCSCDTWTLTGELRGKFGTMSLRGILGYLWHVY